MPIEAHDCAKCGPNVKLNRSNAQRILEHMGAHILHDATLNRSQEVCGLCLRPSPMCRLLVKKGVVLWQAIAWISTIQIVLI